MPQPPAYHVSLLQNIGQQLTGEYEQKLRRRLIVEGFPPGRVEKKSAFELLQLLDRRRDIAPGRYEKLREILINLGRKDLVDLHLDLINADTNQVHGNLVTEEELSRLANELGPEWKSFGLEQLGMTQTNIDQCIASDPIGPVRNHMFNMLCCWKYREGVNATGECLIRKLEAHGVDQSCIECLTK